MARMRSYGAAAAVIDIPEHDPVDEALECINDSFVASGDDSDDHVSERRTLLKRRRNVGARPPSAHSWWSRIFFTWCTPLARICEQRPLRSDDLWPMHEHDTSNYCASEFKRVLETSPSSLVVAALWTQKRLVFWSGVISLGAVVCELTGPIAVYMVVSAAASGELGTVYSSGAIWTLVLLASRFLRSYALAWAEHLLRFVDVRVSGALQVLLIESVLDLEPFAPRHFSSKGSANLFTVDVATVGSSFRMIHRLWMVPLEFIGLFYTFRWVAGRVITGILLVSCGIYAMIQLVTWSDASLLRQWLAISDQRFGILERIFHHVLAIKLNTWEDWALERVLSVRETEERVLQRHVLLRTLRYTLAWIAPSLNLIATGILLVNIPNLALASPAFTFSAVAIFHAINDSFSVGVSVVQVFSQCRVSLERINDALRHTLDARRASQQRRPSLEPSGRTHSLGRTGEDAVTVVNASFANPSARDNNAELLTNVTLRVQHGEFVVVYGKVGCGKSVLLSALLGFLPKQRGGAYVNGSVAYCSQLPWIQSMSIRDNVLFGHAFDAVRYWSVLEACCLLEDLAQMPAGDRTILGSHGLVSLSGGQQARVALARACYADTDILVLDAPLDSVDSIVQCEILLKCMGQLLQHKTVILTTHNPEVILCEYVDRAIPMEHMALQEPASRATSASRYSRRTAARSKAQPRSAPQAFRSKRSILLGSAATRGGLAGMRREATASSEPPAAPTRSLQLNDAILLDPRVLAIQAAARTRPAPSPTSALSSSSPSTFVNHASCAYRKRGWSGVLKEYIAYTQSFSVLCVVVFLHHMTQVLSTMSVYYFSRWIASTGRAKESPEALEHTIALFQRYMWIVAASCALFLCAAFATFSFSLTAAGKLFACMTSALLHAPLRFFATNSVGRILNRYARDLRAVDSSLQSVLFALLRSFFSSYCSLFASLAWLSGHVLKLHTGGRHHRHDGDNESNSSTSASLLWWLVMLVNVAVTTGVLGAFWRDGIRSNKPSGEVYLMYRESQSPLFSFVTESMIGKRVIAAFGPATTRQVARTYGAKVDDATRVLLAMWSFETYVTLRCLLIETLLTSALLIALIALGHDEPSVANEPATIGLLLFLLLNIREDLKHSFANWNLLEKDLACVQRILAYIHVEPEGGALSQHQVPVDPFWPRTGAITFDRVSFQYDSSSAVSSPLHERQHRSSLSPTTTLRRTSGMALRNVSFHIDGGQKIGVVGRSGAGKSSLAMALMRVTDPVEGVIRIDGVDVTQLHVKTLRSKISYVPPNPVFANATVRAYLDPMARVSDAALWAILKKTGVDVSVLKLQASLDANIMDMVGTWSAGERQLLCLSRALVLRSRIVILDEATTATDQETDCNVQDVVCELLDATTTLLCIAHRLDTVLEFDKILVMADGGVEDFGTVQELVAAGDGVFYHLLESAQLVY